MYYFSWTFHFGCQMVAKETGGKIQHPLGFKDGTPWKVLVVICGDIMCFQS